jgi:hypothetical protein
MGSFSDICLNQPASPEQERQFRQARSQLFKLALAFR